ncbi:Cytochrome P450 2J6 [Amphibalanus amphitrite]|uniref:Cytochrome P450 2J6 n=1 Tax=Amphibalanus amphitrite TaxID=1232801 RepID=A0A6A4W3H9_AMPAM|nr:Cytochrome P450 2J6 [Amphibalanus amphitrite]
MFLWLVVAVVAVVIWAWKSMTRPSWCPQGPPLLPWIGNALSLDPAAPESKYSEWAEQYGSMYYVKLGAVEQVVLTDPALIREAFSRPEVSGRPDTASMVLINNNNGLVMSEGELWRETRRFTLHHLRNFGMGKSQLEGYIQQQIAGFCEEILKPGCGKEISLESSLNVAIVNIIWNLVASEELGITDEKIKSVINRINRLNLSTDGLQAFAVLDLAPWVQKVTPDWLINRERFEKEFADIMKEGFLPALQRHRDSFDPGSEPRDYMDAMLLEQHRRPELMTDHHLLMAIHDLFLAGNDTTATTLRWAFCFLCQRPDVQRRLQAELDAEVGRQRPPTLADRQRLPFTEAFILETQRLGDITPLLVPHRTVAPVSVGGRHLPAGVQVVGVGQAVHRSARYFAEPLQFRPERFIDSDGKFQPDKNVMPFSVGKRQCLGESLARNELFLFLACILQNFSFRFPEGYHHHLEQDPDNVFIRSPKPFKLIPERR